jgi:1-acyl-sn-glycerol-3-phosphate acyltransferase
MVYVIVSAIIRLLLPLQMRLRVYGAERCPRTGPVIIVANHLGLLDPLAIAILVPRQVRILAKSEVFQWLILGGIARACGVVPVHRGASDREALRTLTELLAQGQCVELMPEGTYPKVPLPPAMIPVKTGAAFLAVRTGALVQPVGITGTERVWAPKRGWKIWHRPRVTITFGEPYRPQAPTGVSSKAVYHAVAEDMAYRIAALLPPSYRGHYAGGSLAASPSPAHEQSAGNDLGIE